MNESDGYLALLELLRSVQTWSGGEQCLGCHKPVGADGLCRRKRCVVGHAQLATEENP